MIRQHAFDDATGRRLFSLEVESADALPPLALPSRHFVCLIAWDARGVPFHEVSSLVLPLLRAGASYVVCWGPDCQRVHDIVDQVAHSFRSDFDAPEDSCVNMTWQASKPLREALWMFLV
ncbi:MAG: hypothetical protein ACLGHP_10610, partial [Vicinamibacteria bacterium]